MTRKAVAQAIVRINDDLEALLDGKDLDTPVREALPINVSIARTTHMN